MDSLIVIDDQPLTIDDMLGRLAQFLRLNVADGDASRHTLRTYMSHVKQFVEWCEAQGLHPARASHEDLVQFRRFLVEGRGYKRGTIAYKLNAVRRFYEAARAWGLRADNPAEGLRAPRDPTSRRDRILERYLSPEEVHRLLDAPPTSTIAGRRDRAILRLFYYHGLRVSAVVRLNMEHLIGSDPFQMRIEGKGRKSRSIFLVDPSLSALRQWLSARREVKGVEIGLDAPVFVSLDRPTYGTRLTTEGVRWFINMWLMKCDLKRPGLSCHALRHAHATHVIEKDPGLLLSLSRELGHSNIETTQTYLHAAQALLKNPASVLEGGGGQ